jgi:hypothetical protein
VSRLVALRARFAHLPATGRVLVRATITSPRARGSEAATIAARARTATSSSARQAQTTRVASAATSRSIGRWSVPQSITVSSCAARACSRTSSSPAGS